MRALEDLAARERAMHELDNGKDQVMTVMKVALANLGMWARNRWFPEDYAHATWGRLEPFFRLPGRVVYGADTVHVELRPFNDRQLNRDLTAVCVKVQGTYPQLPDGRRLLISMEGATSLISDAQQRRVA